MQRGYTLIEIVIVLVVVGILVCVAAPRVSSYIDWLAVNRAESETASFYSKARMTAVHRAVRMRIGFYADSLIAVAEYSVDSVVSTVPGPARHGVAFFASRAETRLYPNGLGLGAANTKLIFRRGRVADSLTISRLGRLRRYP